MIDTDQVGVLNVKTASVFRQIYTELQDEQPGEIWVYVR